MSLTKISGFFSYAHDDDVCGRLRMLRDDLIAEYRQLTGNDLELFLDRDDIKWGDRWEKNIGAGIDSSSFFIPVLSPLYFKSEYCRERELRQFLEKVERESAKELLLPIYYVDLDYVEKDIDAELIRRVFGYQYEDWREIRFAERCTEKYRRAVGRLASRLVGADREIWLRSTGSEDNADTPVAERGESVPDAEREIPSDEENPDGKGFLMEETERLNQLSGEFVPHVEQVAKKMEKIGQIVKDYTGRVDAAGKGGPKAMTALFTQLATDLDPVADGYLAEAEECSNLMDGLDSSMRAIAARRNDLQALNDVSSAEDADDYRHSVDELVEVAGNVRGSLGTFNSQITVLKGLSRVLYRPLRKIERANILMDDVLGTAAKWSS